MPMQTTVTITGTITDQPQLTLAADVPHAQVAIVVPGRLPSAAGWQYAPARQYTVRAAGALAEHLAISLRTGDRVIVRGRLQPRERHAHDGTQPQTWEITAYDVAVSLRCAPALPVRTASRGAA